MRLIQQSTKSTILGLPTVVSQELYFSYIKILSILGWFGSQSLLLNLVMNNLLKEITDIEPKDISEDEYCIWLSDYLNRKVNDKYVNCKDYIQEITQKKTTAISSLRNLSNNLSSNINESNYHEVALIKIRSKRYDYLISKSDKYYIFNFDYLAKRYNDRKYFDIIIKKCLVEIEKNDLINLLNDLNYITSIESQIESLRKSKIPALFHWTKKVQI